MAKKKRKPNKIEVVDYEACWKTYRSLIYQACLMAKATGNTEAIKGANRLNITLDSLEKKHTKPQTLQ